MTFDTILIETRGRVGLITLNRPKALNALSAAVLRDIAAALAAFDADDGVGCVIVAGSERAFAAGSDVKEMAGVSAAEAEAADLYADIDAIAAARKPVIAAVAGYALGGGCELAMACDIILAADTARFGQPELTLGIIPGLGGTQRLPRLVGRARAMELILSGRTIDAAEAERIGLVSRMVPAAELLPAALALAERIAALPLSAVLAAKTAIVASFEAPLAQGLAVERRLFRGLFGTPGQREGMAAFVEKRPPRFR